jgi:cation transport regulator ChaB
MGLLDKHREQFPVVLPSEIAQQLAAHLEQNQEMYTEGFQAAIHPEELAWVIQEFYDSIP